MSEMYKAGDRVEFIEGYMGYKIGDTATVKIASDWSATNQILDLGDNFSVLSYRVKRAAPEIGVGDLVKINDKTPVPSLVGVEGIVVDVLDNEARFTVTNRRNSWVTEGETLALGQVKFDVVKTAAELAAEDAEPKVGDKVRVTEGAWEGSEGVVEFRNAAVTGVKMTAPSKGCWISKGRVGRVTSSIVKITEPEAEPQARVVKRSEVMVGDLVRVTYPTVTVTDPSGRSNGVVKDSVTRVREGIVTKVSGPELHSGSTILNAYFDGLAKAVYEVLPTPKPERVPTWAEKMEIGSTGLQKGGQRFLIKKDEDAWEIRYPSSLPAAVRTNGIIADMFKEEDFLWTVRK